MGLLKQFNVYHTSFFSTHIAPNTNKDQCQYNLYYGNLLDSDRLARAWGAETEQLHWESFGQPRPEMERKSDDTIQHYAKLY